MFKSVSIHKGHTILNLIFNIITLGVIIMVLNFMNDLAKNPNCSMIDPLTREGLNSHSWILLVLTVLSMLGNLYIIFLV